MKYKTPIKKISKIIKKIPSLGILNKFRKGVTIIKIKPSKLLIKNLG